MCCRDFSIQSNQAERFHILGRNYVALPLMGSAAVAWVSPNDQSMAASVLSVFHLPESECGKIGPILKYAFLVNK